MTVWKSTGASVIGPAHLASGKLNQDAWASFHHAWGDGIVVSDGLGSKPFSDFGSHAACLAVAGAFHAYRGAAKIEQAALTKKIRENWLFLIAPLTPQDCAATCLFAFRTGGMLTMGRLGDGLVAALKTDDTLVTLAEDKSDGFSNITAALSTSVTEKDWQCVYIPEDTCNAIILCTDGVADDLSDAEGFIRAFIDAHRDLSTISAARHIREALENWPTPKHSDDKTIACLFREEVADE